MSGHRSIDDRVALLESQMQAMRVEMGRVSATTQRLEARQLQSVGVTPEPTSKMAKPIETAPKRKPAANSTEAAKTAQVDPRDPWAQPASPAPAKAADTPAPAAAPEQKEAGAAPDQQKPEPKPEQKVASATPAPAAPPTPAPAPAATPAAPPAAATPETTGFAVQLGAFGSIQRAATGWDEAKAKAGPLLSDLLPKREAIGQDGKTIYRLKAGPLPDREAAAKRCDALKAKSIPCLITAFSGEWPSS